MIGIKMTADDREITARSTALIKTLGSKEINMGLVEEVRSGVIRQFETEGEGKWPELSEKWAVQRAKMGYSYGEGNPLLVMTGRLLDSIQTEATDKGGTVFVNMVYARAHNYGFEKRKLPSRPFMVVTDEAKKKCLNLIQRKIKNV